MDDFVAVFNSTKRDYLAARYAVLKKFGAEGWDEVKLRKRGGIMAIFDDPPTPPTSLFVKIVAENVRWRLDERAPTKAGAVNHD